MEDSIMFDETVPIIFDVLVEARSDTARLHHVWGRAALALYEEWRISLDELRVGYHC